MSLVKNLALALISIAVFALLIEGSLAVVGFDPELYEKDPLVGFSSQIPLFTPMKKLRKMQTAANKRALFNYQRFDRAKPKGAYRVFCMGGSTTFGRPYADKTSFCGWLRELLPVADPSRNWELINAGGISYASYRVAALMEEITAYEPDLFIIYTGHNEFLEARTYGDLLEASQALIEARALLNRTRSYTALKRVIEKVRGRSAGELMQKNVLAGEVDAVLDDSVGLQSYHRDDELSRGVLSHFRINLNRMVDVAGSVDAASVLVTPASNLRHCSPFKSERRAGISEADRLAWDDWMSKARRRLGRDRPVRALEAVDAAVEIDPRHAEGLYLRGQILFAAERYDDARLAFASAIDEDVCPIRALSETLEIVSEVARDRDVPVVEWARYLKERSEHGITGETFFLDHVHPTIEANRLLALLLIAQLQTSGVVEYAPGWTESAIAEVAERVESGLDDRAHGRALTNLAKVFGWAGKTEEAQVLALRALESVDDAETYNNVAMTSLRLGQIEEAIGYYLEVLKRKPKHAPALSDIGYAYAQLERYDEAVEYLRKSIALQDDNERSRYNLGHVFSLQGRYPEAIAELRAAMRINPRRGEYHQVLGDIYFEIEDFDRAMASFERALELNPRLPKAHYSRAVLLEQIGKADAAVDDLRAVVELSPNSPRALTRLALILSTDPDPNLRDGESATRLARSAVRITKGRDPDALGALAAALAEQQEFEDAIFVARNAIDATDPSDAVGLEQVRANLATFERREPRRASR